MSWSFDFIAENSDAVGETLGGDTAVPAMVRAAIVDAAKETARAEGQALRVKSSGHLGQYGGQAGFEVSTVPYVRALVAEPAPAPQTPAPEPAASPTEGQGASP